MMNYKLKFNFLESNVNASGIQHRPHDALQPPQLVIGEVAQSTESSTMTNVLMASSSSDIASSSHESPVQPILNSYPVTKYGNKDHSFNASWYSKHNWLEYSLILDAAFCYSCRFFAHGSSKADD